MTTYSFTIPAGINPPTTLARLRSDGDKIYIGDRGATPYIYTLDNTFTISDPSLNNILSMSVSNTHIYTGDNRKIFIIKKSDQTIHRITLLGLPGNNDATNIYEVAFDNTYLYFTAGVFVYYIPDYLDINSSVSITPTKINFDITIPGTINALRVAGSKLYFAHTKLYSISLPFDPTMNTVTDVGTPDTQYLIDDIAYFPNYPGGGQLFCLSRTTNKVYRLDGNVFTQFTNTFDPPISGSILRTMTYDNSNFMYLADATQVYKSTISLFCFNKGTKILYLSKKMKDKYTVVENLKKGDFVKTYKHGYRKISKIITGTFQNNPNKWNMCMYKMTKTESNGLIEDLIVTGGHSLLVDSISETEQAKYDEMGLTEWSKQTIDGKRLLLACVSEQFTSMPDNDVYTYYHLLLENNNDEEERFGIWANGILTETPNEKTLQ